MASPDDSIPPTLHVAVTPSQAAFFAGEPLTVTITITNSRPPLHANGHANGTSLGRPFSPTSGMPGSAVSAKTHHGRSQSVTSPRHAHKRSSHSVSHVPIAHPPTSPGIGQIRHASSSSLSLPASSSKQVFEEVKEIRRKNRIGKGIRSGQLANGENGSAHEKGKGRELNEEVIQLRSMIIPDKRNGVLRGVHDDVRLAAVTSPRISSPLARDSSFPSSHPHARKPSTLDGSSASSTLGLPTPSPLGPSPLSSAATSVTSFSASLDAIAESPRSGGSSNFCSPAATPAQSAIPSPPPYQYAFVPASIEHSSSPYLQPNAPRTAPIPDMSGGKGSLVAAQAALGRGYPQQPHTAATSTFPHTNGRAAPSDDGSELVLYSYVHFTGMLALLPPPLHEQAWTETVRRMRIRRRLRGGGSMDITTMSPQATNIRHNRHARRGSLSAGIWGLLSPTSPTSPTSPADGAFKPGHRMRASTSSPFFTPSARGIGLGVEGVGDALEDQELDAPMSVFEVPNAMLGVDIRLKPGESKSWTYTINLPDWLPPTYSGRAINFSYQLAVGTCRALPEGSNSRVMKVPVRVYNHVSVDRAPSSYDLMRNVETGTVSKLVEDTAKSRSEAQSMPFSPLPLKGTTSSLRTYAEQLLAPLALQELALSPGEVEPEREGQGALTGCREAVEVLTRVPKRISYDVQKDGVVVAVLTFTKAAWRLGETVQGVVEVNPREGRARVLKLSAYLEAHESLPGVLATSAAEAKLMRRVYAEDHAAVLSCTLRTAFALDIPSDASPAFSLKLGDASTRANGFTGTSHSSAPAGSPGKGGGVEWKVRVCLLVCVAPERASIRMLRRESDIGEWGSAFVPLATPLCRRASASLATPAASTDSVSSWTGWLSSIVAPMPTTFHDGDDEDASSDACSDESEDDERLGGWEEMRTEMVECEVPVRVWPGNTAFRAMDVVFDV